MNIHLPHLQWIIQEDPVPLLASLVDQVSHGIKGGEQKASVQEDIFAVLIDAKFEYCKILHTLDYLGNSLSKTGKSVHHVNISPK